MSRAVNTMAWDANNNNNNNNTNNNSSSSGSGSNKNNNNNITSSSNSSANNSTDSNTIATASTTALEITPSAISSLAADLALPAENLTLPELHQQLVNLTSSSKLELKSEQESQNTLRSVIHDLPLSSVRQAEPSESSDAEGHKQELEQQEAAATALQLLGLSQQFGEGKEGSTDPTAAAAAAATAVVAAAGVTSFDPNSSAKENYKRGSWTKEEDDLLLAGIKKFGYGRWKEIAATIPGRKGKQLKQRWDNTLASKYVDIDWLQSKIKGDNPEGVEAVSAFTTALPTGQGPPYKFFGGDDWSTLTQKVGQKPKTENGEGDDDEGQGAGPVAVGALNHQLNAPANSGAFPRSSTFSESTYQALYQHLQNTTTADDTEEENEEQAAQNAATASQYFLANPFQTSSNGNDANTASNSGPNTGPDPNSALKRRRTSEGGIGTSSSSSMELYASTTPITTTVNNQTQTVYPCLYPTCGKTFARLYNLKSHSRTHTDDRPYSCQLCSQAFSRNHDLKRHVKIHCGAKPYKCEGCGKSFSRLDALKRHHGNSKNRAGCAAGAVTA